MSGPKLPATRHIPYLDGWRGLAISLVLANHFLHAPAGRLGVDVFFVLSGMLMAQVLFVDRPSMATFYQRRIARIFPAFSAFLAVMAVWSAFDLSSFPLGQLLFNALFLQQYQPSGVAFSPDIPIGHLWSLNVEEHSYVVLSLLALAARTERAARWCLTAASIACAIVYGCYIHAGTPTADFIFKSQCAAFPLLTSTALFLWLRSAGNVSRLFLIGVAGVIGSIVASRLLHGSAVLDYLSKSFFLALTVNTLRDAPRAALRALSATWIRWLGLCSFSVYLWQQPFYHLVGRHDPIVLLVCSLLVGSASYHGLEKPLRRYINGLRVGAAGAPRTSPDDSPSANLNA